jgi:hypothetical protein
MRQIEHFRDVRRLLDARQGSSVAAGGEHPEPARRHGQWLLGRARQDGPTKVAELDRRVGSASGRDPRTGI